MKDVAINADGALVIAHADLVIATSDVRHQQSLLETAPGSWKQHPDVGVDAMMWLESEDEGGLRRAINQQFVKDGMTKDNQVDARTLAGLVQSYRY